MVRLAGMENPAVPRQLLLLCPAPGPHSDFGARDLSPGHGVDPGTSGTVLTCGMCTWPGTGGTGLSHCVLCAGREEVTASILLPGLSPPGPQFSRSDFFRGDCRANPHPPTPFAPFSAVKSPVKDLLLMVSKYFWKGSQVSCIPSRWPKPLSVEDPGMSCWGNLFSKSNSISVQTSVLLGCFAGQELSPGSGTIFLGCSKARLDRQGRAESVAFACFWHRPSMPISQE